MIRRHAAERSSVVGLAASAVPLFVTTAQYEPRKFHPQAANLLRAVMERRG